MEDYWRCCIEERYDHGRGITLSLACSGGGIGSIVSGVVITVAYQIVSDIGDTVRSIVHDIAYGITAVFF